MAQVPYTVSPGVEPSDPRISISTPESAFGGTIAQATAGFGQDIEKVGNELWGRAVEYRNLQNEANVNQATTNYLMDSGDLDNKFRQLQGDQAQAQLQTHIAALQTAREKYKATLNPLEQKLYDRETMRRFGYDVINASGYAGTQMKTFTKQTREAGQLAWIDRMVADPMNEDFIKEGLHNIIASESQNSVEDGDPNPLTQERIKAKIAKAIEAVAKARARTHPDEADALVDAWKERLGRYYEPTLDAVNQRGIQTRAIMEGARIAGPDQSLIDARKAGINVRTEKLSPEMRDRASDAIAAAEAATGAKASIDSAFRTTAEQAKLYQKFLAGGGRAAPPGKSLHEQGEALDLQDGPVLQKLREWYKDGSLETKYGLTMLPDKLNDPGHMQLAAGRKAYEKPVQVAGPSMGEEQDLVAKHKAAEESAERLYPSDRDPVLHQQYLDALVANIDKRASVQKKELTDRTNALKGAIGQTMNQILPNGRQPTNINEATSIDPHFADRVDQAVKLDPTYQSRLDNWFHRNARQDIPQTQEHLDNYYKYLGLSNEDRQRVDGNKMFLQGQLTQGLANKIMEDQAKIQHAAQEHARVDPILARHHELLNDAQAYPSKTDSSANEKYTWLRGALVRRLEDHIAQKHALMTPKEEDETMQSLVGEVVTRPNLKVPLMGWEVPYTYSTKPSFEVESLQYPVTINSIEQRNGLRHGQKYIFNGVQATKP